MQSQNQGAGGGLLHLASRSRARVNSKGRMGNLRTAKVHLDSECHPNPSFVVFSVGYNRWGLFTVHPSFHHDITICY